MMIPLIDDYIQFFLVQRLRWLKQHPLIIDHIFHTAKRETLESLKSFILSKPVKVIIGYPKEQSSLPAYVIVQAPETEQPMGIGDDSETFEGWELSFQEQDTDNPDEKRVIQIAEAKMSEFLAGTYMNVNFRIECWSDNGDLTAYMYSILKWAMWSSRMDMIKMGWVNPRLSGTDLEPVPDYFPIFVYRRALSINALVENLYYENLADLENAYKVLEHPEQHTVTPEGDITDEEGNVVLPRTALWILRIRYVDGDGHPVLTSVYNSQSTPDITSVSNGDSTEP